MRIKSGFRSHWLVTELPPLLLLIVLVTAGRSTLADHYYVPSGSMEYTLMPGDRVFVDKTAYGFRLPFTNVDVIKRDPVGRGEIVIFDSPRDDTRLIKRIVAIGGDQVTLKAGRLAINGVLLAIDGDQLAEEFGSRIALLNLNQGGGPDIDGIKVPDGMLLAVGDHRGNSLDGRIFGFVPESEVYGRAVAVYYRRGDGFRWQPL